jgi:hypothetical protein
MPDVKMVTGIPMDRNRVMADPRAIGEFYANVRTLIAGVPRSFVVNMDESGFADYPDARRKTVIVPAAFPDGTIPFHSIAARKALHWLQGSQPMERP